MTPHLGLQRIMIPSAQVSSLTTGSITLPSAKGAFVDNRVQFLVIAGGGSGGDDLGGGGGAGGYRSSVLGETSGRGASAESLFTAALSTNYTVTVGAGGPYNGSTFVAANGSNSVFATITSTGGGLGQGNAGGAGGGGTANGNPGVAGAGTSAQGFDGGNGTNQAGGSARTYCGGGGGGAGAIGGTAVSQVAGNGGAGLASSITGTSVTRAGGGGGGATNDNGFPTGTRGTGGSGGGGNGGQGANGSSGQDGVSGTVNTGSGGGGGATRTGVAYNYGGGGGSGVVILRYPTAFGTITVGAGLTGSTATDGSFKVTTITAGTGNVSWA